MNKEYIVTKVVSAKNITQALKMEKETEVDSIELLAPKKSKKSYGFQPDSYDS